MNLELLDKLYVGTRSQRSSIRAVAFVADVRIPGNPEDAIRVELEHRGGIAIAVLLPYRKRQQSPGIDYEALRERPPSTVSGLRQRSARLSWRSRSSGGRAPNGRECL